MLVAGAAGVLLLGYVVASLGPARIAAHLAGLGAILPAVLGLTGLKYPLQTAGWRSLLPPSERPPWGESLAATITGDALGYVTWAGPFAGEPMRALLIRDSVPLADGIAAGAAERALYDVTAAVLVAGVLLALLSVEHGIAALVLAILTLAVVLAAISLVRGGWRRRAAEPRSSAAVSQHARGGRITRLRRTLRELWRTRRGMLPVVAALCLAQHALLVGEAYLMLGVLGGTPRSGRRSCSKRSPRSSTPPAWSCRRASGSRRVEAPSSPTLWATRRAMASAWR